MSTIMQWTEVLQNAVIGAFVAAFVSVCFNWRTVVEIAKDFHESVMLPDQTPKRRHKVGDAAHSSLGVDFKERQANSVSMLNAGAWRYEDLPDGHPLKVPGYLAKCAACRSDDDRRVFDASLLSSISISVGEDLGVILEDGKPLAMERARQQAREWWPDLTDKGFETALASDRTNRASWRA